MYTLLMKNDKHLYVTKSTKLYQGENLVDELQFLVPTKYNKLDLSTCTATLEYVEPGNVFHTEKLVLSSKLYRDYLLDYRLPIRSKLTKLAGKIKMMITFRNNSGCVLHTSEVSITINPVSYHCQCGDGFENENEGGFETSGDGDGYSVVEF